MKRTAIVAAVAGAFLALGAPSAFAASGGVKLPAKKVSMRIPIFLYHYVEVVRNPKDTMRVRLAVRTDVFEKQLQTIQAAGFETAFMRDVPAILAGKETAKNTVILTFDDGYEDFYTDVFPLLQKYNMKATLYVINDFVGTNDYVTEAQLEELAASGFVEIGAHTLHHKDLKILSSAKAHDEIAGSKNDLEGRLHQPIESFAYPFGSLKNETVKIVRDAGFATAVTTKGGALQSSDGLLLLRRLRPNSQTGKSLQRLLKG
jgi:peptidoglycan/xylan/chitin deacetylase (PgdA/CDA1 family)